MNARQPCPSAVGATFVLGSAAWVALLLVACARPESAGPAPVVASPRPAAPAGGPAPEVPAPASTAPQARPSPQPPGAPRATPPAPTGAEAPPPASSPTPTATTRPAPPVPSAPAVADPGGAVAVAATRTGLTRVGVQKCGLCHKRQRESWAASAHARRTPPLDCESCHGAGSEYVSLAVMKDPQKARAAGLVLPAAAFCQTCHQHAWQPDMLSRVHAHKTPAGP